MAKVRQIPTAYSRQRRREELAEQKERQRSDEGLKKQVDSRRATARAIASGVWRGKGR